MLAIYLIGLLSIVVVVISEYLYQENRQVKKEEYEWKQKYYDQMEINNELLDQILAKDEGKFDPDVRIK